MIMSGSLVAFYSTAFVFTDVCLLKYKAKCADRHIHIPGVCINAKVSMLSTLAFHLKINTNYIYLISNLEKKTFQSMNIGTGILVFVLVKQKENQCYHQYLVRRHFSLPFFPPLQLKMHRVLVMYLLSLLGRLITKHST